MSSSPRTENRQIFTVSQVTEDIKVILENTFSGIWVEGEVSNCRPSSAGHLYFSLKDEQSVLSSVLFSRSAAQIKFKLEDGMKIICFGGIDVYAPRGQYQLIIEQVEPKGVGSLQLALEQLKARLEKEGLFRPERKRRIPYLPSRIGVVTSPTGAAIKDMLKVLDRRFRDVHIVINPVRVQGEGAAEEIAAAIRDFNRYNTDAGAGQRVDVLIVGRGGGSIEDLWAFNEEAVARAIHDSRIPVISAVGHERDWTIADLVADVRAATPSVAAELAIPPKAELREKLDDECAAMRQSMEHLLALAGQRCDTLRRHLERANPAVLIPEHKQRLEDGLRQMSVRMQHYLQMAGSRLAGQAEKLASLNPLNILSRGYSVTFSQPDGAIVKDAAALRAGQRIRTVLYRGTVTSEVISTEEGGRHGRD